MDALSQWPSPKPRQGWISPSTLSLSLNVLYAHSLSWTSKIQEEEIKACVFKVSFLQCFNFFPFPFPALTPQSIFSSNIHLKLLLPRSPRPSLRPCHKQWTLLFIWWDLLKEFKWLFFLIWNKSGLSPFWLFHSLLCKLSSSRLTSEFGVSQDSGLRSASALFPTPSHLMMSSIPVALGSSVCWLCHI